MSRRKITGTTESAWEHYVLPFSWFKERSEAGYDDRKWATFARIYDKGVGLHVSDTHGDVIGDSDEHEIWDLLRKTRVLQVLLWWHHGVYIHPTRRSNCRFPSVESYDTASRRLDNKPYDFKNSKYDKDWMRNFVGLYVYYKSLKRKWNLLESQWILK